MTIQIKESQIPQELRNLRPPVYKGDSILITEVHDCDIEACRNAVGQVQEFSHMVGTEAATVDDVWAKSWVKVNEPVDVCDRILVLQRYARRGENVGQVVMVVSTLDDKVPYFVGGAESTGRGYAEYWVKMPALAKEEPPTTFQVGDVVRYHDRDLPSDLVDTPGYLVGASGVVTSVRALAAGRDHLSTNIAKSYGYDDARRFDLVRRAGEQEQEEPKAPFVVGDWVKDTSDGNRIGKVTDDISSHYLYAHENCYDNEFFGAFEVEFVDGEPMRLACVWGSELEKLEVNPEVEVGEDITVLEWLWPATNKPALPYTSPRVLNRLAEDLNCIAVSTPGGGHSYAKTWIRSDEPTPGVQDKPKYKVGDLVTINDGGRTPILPAGTLMRVQEVVDNWGVVLKEVEGLKRPNFERVIADVDPFTEDISVGDKVVLTEAAFDVFAPAHLGDVVGKFVKKDIYYLVSGINESRLVCLTRPEIKKWTPHREATARQKLEALKAEKAEADKVKAHKIRLEELKAATVVRQGEYVHLSNPGSSQWIEYKKSSFTFDSNELIDDEDDRECGAGPIEILK